MLHLVDLHDSCSAGKVSHANELGAAGNPFTVEDGVVQTLLDMCDYLWLCQRGWHPCISAVYRDGVLFLLQSTERTGWRFSLPEHMTYGPPLVLCRDNQRCACKNNRTNKHAAKLKNGTLYIYFVDFYLWDITLMGAVILYMSNKTYFYFFRQAPVSQ